jgi:hypothetical protein
MSGFSRMRRCDHGCPTDMVPLWPVPDNPDRWVRSLPVGWWLTNTPPMSGEGPGAVAYRCPRCGQTVRTVGEVAAARSA